MHASATAISMEKLPSYTFSMTFGSGLCPSRNKDTIGTPNTGAFVSLTRQSYIAVTDLRGWRTVCKPASSQHLK